jgi:ABC-type uncharacterized transport system involved in gliding motility auxiliary subunit
MHLVTLWFANAGTQTPIQQQEQRLLFASDAIEFQWSSYGVQLPPALLIDLGAAAAALGRLQQLAKSLADITFHPAWRRIERACLDRRVKAKIFCVYSVFVFTHLNGPAYFFFGIWAL